MVLCCRRGGLVFKSIRRLKYLLLGLFVCLFFLSVPSSRHPHLCSIVSHPKGERVEFSVWLSSTWITLVEAGPLFILHSRLSVWLFVILMHRHGRAYETNGRWIFWCQSSGSRSVCMTNPDQGRSHGVLTAFSFMHFANNSVSFFLSVPLFLRFLRRRVLQTPVLETVISK